MDNERTDFSNERLNGFWVISCHRDHHCDPIKGGTGIICVNSGRTALVAGIPGHEKIKSFSSPDFTGKLLASVRLGDTLGTETKTGSLAVTNDIVVPFLSVCTNNAVVLDGIRVGTVYVRAFVDRNGNFPWA